MLRAIDEIGAREGLGALLAEGSRAAARVVGQGSEAFAPHVKGLELPGYEPRTLQAMALGPGGQRARRRPQPLGRLRGRPLRPPRPPRRRVSPTSRRRSAPRTAPRSWTRSSSASSCAACSRTRSPSGRGCSAASPAGTSTARSSRRRPAGSCSPSARSTPARGGRGPTTACPSRFLTESLEVASGRSATLTRERLDAMIEEYYEARGLDTSGLLKTGQIEDLRLGVVVR